MSREQLADRSAEDEVETWRHEDGALLTLGERKLAVATFESLRQELRVRNLIEEFDEGEQA